MSRPRVVVVSPGPVLDYRRRELQRLFGQEVEVTSVSHFEHDPRDLVQAIRDAKADAVVLGTAPPAHRAKVEALIGEIPSCGQGSSLFEMPVGNWRTVLPASDFSEKMGKSTVSRTGLWR